MKICLIRQPAGIGDILVCKKIGHVFNFLNYKVIWPIQRAIMEIIPYITTEFKYICEDEPFPFSDLYHMPRKQQRLVDSDEVTYLPLQYATDYCSNLIFRSKYILATIDISDWSNYLFFNRDHKKEDDLYYNILGLKDKEEYALLNVNYGTQPGNAKIKIPIKTNKKIISTSFIPGMTAFDWCKVIENASELHTVDTCFTIIIEKLDLQTDEIFLYCKDGSENPSVYLFSKPWNLCY
jgi:hypothetical protein